MQSGSHSSLEGCEMYKVRELIIERSERLIETTRTGKSSSRKLQSHMVPDMNGLDVSGCIYPAAPTRVVAHKSIANFIY